MSYFHAPLAVLRGHPEMAAALDRVDAANRARLEAHDRAAVLRHMAFDLATERSTDLASLAALGELVDLRLAEREYNAAEGVVEKAEKAVEVVFAREDVRQSLSSAAAVYYLDAQRRAEAALDDVLAALAERQSVEEMARVGLGSRPYWANRLNAMGIGTVIDDFSTYVRVVPVDALRSTAEGK